MSRAKIDLPEIHKNRARFISFFRRLFFFFCTRRKSQKTSEGPRKETDEQKQQTGA